MRRQTPSPAGRFLRPPIVVGMGSCGWRAVRRVFALDHAPERISQAAGSCWTSADGTRVFAVGHPGPQGLTNRPWPQQLADWRRIGEAVSAALVGSLLVAPMATDAFDWRASKKHPRCRNSVSDQKPLGAMTRRSWRSASRTPSESSANRGRRCVGRNGGRRKRYRYRGAGAERAAGHARSGQALCRAPVDPERCGSRVDGACDRRSTAPGRQAADRSSPIPTRRVSTNVMAPAELVRRPPTPSPADRCRFYEIKLD